MTGHNDDANMTEITTVDPIITQQNELIAQLMQQIAEMKRAQEPASRAITADFPVPDHERPPVHCPSPDQSHQPLPISTNPPIIPFINLTTPNAGPSDVISQIQHNAQADSTSHIAQAPDRYNLPSTQAVLPKTPLNPYIPHLNYPKDDHYQEKEEKQKAKEKMTKSDIREEVTKAMKQLHYTLDVAGLSYEDLVIHPDLNLPEGFKIPKFDTFDGDGNPLAHLRAYCDQLVGVGKNEALLMRLFSRSLSGEALEWFTSQEINQWVNWSAMAKDFVERFGYNVEILPDRYSLERIKQKSAESYREYAHRWRKNAARVRPPMSEKEIIEVFVRSQEPEFYERMILLVGVKFADIVKVGENIEDGLKTGKVTRIFNSVEASGVLGKRKEDVLAVSGIQGKRRTPSSHPRKSPPPQVHFQHTPQYHPSPYYQSTQYSNYQSPSPICSHVQPTYQDHFASYPAQQFNYQTPSYQRFQTPALPRQNYPNYHQMPPPSRNNYNPPHPNTDKKQFRVFTPLVESRTKLFERLLAVGLIQPAPLRAMDVNSRSFRGDQICAYHSNSVGHNTEECISLKHKIQDLIDRGIVVLRTVAPDGNENPSPDHGGNMTGMIEGEEDWYTAESSTSKHHEG